MSYPLPAVAVTPPGGQTVIVTFKSAGGATATVYADSGGATAVTLPTTITAATVFYLPSGGPWVVSVKLLGVELAGQTVVLEESQVASVSPALPVGGLPPSPNAAALAALAAMSPGGMTGYDTFNRSNRLLSADTAPSGQTYYDGIGAPLVATAIVNGQYQMSAVSFGAGSGSELFMTGTTNPLWVGEAVVWYPGSTSTGFVSLGACIANLTNSVQFDLNPAGLWHMFTVNTGVKTQVGTGTFTHTLPTDGVTATTIMMTWNGSTSVTVTGPQGFKQTFTDATIGTQWGNRLAAQINCPLATDAVPAFLAIAKG